jgi:gamma-glutamyltranspeptidase/glutathione hydrolase
MLNILEAYDIGGMRHNSPEVIHLMVEAKKLAYADRNAYMGDPAFVESPLDELISKEFAAERRRAIDPNEAAKYVKPGPLAAPIPGGDDTSYFCVVDSEGNALSFIHSLSHGFGSGFVAGNTGVCLNNRIGRGFTLTEGHPNVVAPGKRTMHTLNAYIAVGDSGDVLIGGTPGGDNQIQWNAQVLANYIDYGMTPQQSVEAARWDNPPGSDPHMLKDPFTLNLEDDMPEADVKALRSLGHDVIVKRGGLTGGAVQLIVVDTNTGVKKAGSDPRTDGQAVVV